MEIYLFPLNSFFIAGSADFLGYNLYTAITVQASVSPLTPAGYDNDMDVIDEYDPSWPM